MFFRLIMTLVALVVGISTAEAGVIDRFARSLQGGQLQCCAPSIRILLVHDADKAMLEVQGKYVLIDSARHTVLARRVNGKQKHVQAIRSGLKWGEEFPDMYQFKVVPTSADTVIYVNGVPYQGIIAVYDVGGGVSIVNEIDIEDYVADVLAAEVDRPFAKEALAAAAITLRTDAYYRSTFPRNNYWDVDGSDVSYHGLERQPETDAAELAVDATAYMVMNLTTAKKKAVSENDEEVGVFPAHWAVDAPANNTNQPRKPMLILTEAEAAAAQGQNAAQILGKTFPGVVIQRMVTVR